MELSERKKGQQEKCTPVRSPKCAWELIPALREAVYLLGRFPLAQAAW